MERYKLCPGQVKVTNSYSLGTVAIYHLIDGFAWIWSTNLITRALQAQSM
jgi:hypothetical protein